MKSILVFLLIIIPYCTSAQWTYKSGGNDFDGTYKASIVRGTGGESPYKAPSFVINVFNKEKLNIYIRDVGYLGCEGNKMYFKFPGKEEVFQSSSVSTDKENESLFIQSFKNGMSFKDFFTILKTETQMSLRVSNGCFTRDYKFTLQGSTKAIDFVTKDYFSAQEALQKKKEDQLTERLKNLERTLSDDQFNSKEIVRPIKIPIQLTDDVALQYLSSDKLRLENFYGTYPSNESTFEIFEVKEFEDFIAFKGILSDDASPYWLDSEQLKLTESHVKLIMTILKM